MCLVGIGVALFRRSARAVPAGPAARGDVPERLLRWAAGLLSAQRAEWGQAMLGELDHIDGRGRRWRFAAGCAGAALLLPPWGRAAAAVWAMVAVAAGAAGLYAAVAVRYGLGARGWVFAAIMLVFLAGYTLAAGVLLRRPGVALPGCWAACSSPWPGWRCRGSPSTMSSPRGRAILAAGADDRGAAAGGGGRHAVGPAAPRRPAHRPAGRASAPAWACTCTGPSRSRCSAPAGRHRTRARPSATPSATGSATT